jgi:hypothetical protein
MAADPSLENLTPEQRAELNLGKLARQLLTNPETREGAAKLLKKADANLHFPDIEAKDELRKVTEKADEKISALEQKLREHDAKAKLEKQHQKIRDAGLDVKAVVEVMEKIGIPSTEEGYDHVISYIQAQAQIAEPTPETFQPYRIPDLKEMWNDPVKWREEQGYKVLNEMIAQRKRA